MDQQKPIPTQNANIKFPDASSVTEYKKRLAAVANPPIRNRYASNYTTLKKARAVVGTLGTGDFANAFTHNPDASCCVVPPE